MKQDVVAGTETAKVREYSRAGKQERAGFQRAVLLLIVVLLLLPSLIWILIDRSVWPWDPALYGGVSIDLWCCFGKFWRWKHEMVHAFAVKAPGIAWFGQFWVPLGNYIGSIETGLLLSVFATQWATLCLFGAVIGKLFPEKPFLKVIGILAFASSPLFIGLTHHYFVEPLQLFAVVYFYWLALRSFESTRFSITSQFLIATSIAMLAKITSPLYCAFPALITGWNLVRSPAGNSSDVIQPGKRIIDWLLLGFATVLFYATCAWYANHGWEVIHFAREASVGDMALQYGIRDSFFNQLLYWLHASQNSFILLPALILLSAIILLAVFLGPDRSEGNEKTRDQKKLILLSASAHIAVVFVVFGLSINREKRYLLPVLPSLAIVLIWALSMPRSRLARVAACAVFAGQWAIVHAKTLAVYLPASANWSLTQDRELSEQMGMSYWARRAQKNSDRKDELRRLIDLTCSDSRVPRINVCGVEKNWLNADTLTFYAAQKRVETQNVAVFASLGYAADNVDAAWNKVISLPCNFFVSLNEPLQSSPPDFLNKVSLPILAKIQNDQDFVPEPFQSHYGIIVYRHLTAAGQSASKHSPD